MEAAPRLIFITGGVRSGKSRFAERLAVDLANSTDGKLTYLATSVASDPEMVARIKKHKHDRSAAGDIWDTIEQSVRIGELASVITDCEIVLLDCVTTLLNNELFLTEQILDQAFLNTVKNNIVLGITEIKNRARTMIVVSNEVLYESLPENKLVFSYCKLLGDIHQELVEQANQAYLVEAGIPIEMKG